MTGVSISQRAAAAVITLDWLEMTARTSTGVSDALRQLGRDPLTYAVVMKSTEHSARADDPQQSRANGFSSDQAAAIRADRKQAYALCWQIECLSKPMVSFIDDAVSGVSAASMLYGTHRVAGDNYAFSAARSAVDVFPDCGLLHALARMPRGIGRFLALTGRTIDRADAYALGLVTHCIAAERFEEIEALIAEAEPLDPVLDDRHEDVGLGNVLQESGRIERYFGTEEGVESTLERLRRADAGDRPWAESVLADLAARPVPALVLTAEALSRAGALDIDGVLEQDFRLICQLTNQGQPWTATRVDPATIAEMFASRGADELQLRTRSQMQAGRE